MSTRQTGFSDVCGAMDELKRLAAEEPDRLAATPGTLVLPLLEDALFMIGRMRQRVLAYRAFREDIREALGALDRLPEVVETPAARGAEGIREWLRRGAPLDAAGVAELHEAAEEVRSVASLQEGVLRQGKEAALQVHAAFEEVREGRPWLLRDAEKPSAVDRLRRTYQAWLPPEPAAGILLDWLLRDRLTVQEGTRDDGQPVVLFDDGGAIPMSKLRWNAGLENFHPAGSAPGTTGLNYRGRRSRGHRGPAADEA
ncbi:MAG: hypothetical protein JXR77_16995 [Lentisphaeria bacterium]|nr:hypothetical protein [Lentisphaeria bacterium]